MQSDFFLVCPSNFTLFLYMQTPLYFWFLLTPVSFFWPLIFYFLSTFHFVTPLLFPLNNSRHIEAFVFSVQFRCLFFKRTDVHISHSILLHSFFPIFLYFNSLPRRCRLILNLENCTALHIKLSFLSTILSWLETARMLK